MNVPTNMVNLGLGFYGRSFTLADPNCDTPGCPFKEAGIGGECTASPGILSYQEIMTIKKQYNLNAVLDTASGVNYIHWNTDQWVSYDDANTFATKIDYANSVGYVFNQFTEIILIKNKA
jgi:chitinase